MSNINPKKILYVAALVICLSIITGGTLAYFTAEDTARNVITTGSVSVSVVQQQMVGDALQPSSNRPIPVMPDTTVSRVVSVQSTKQTAWVRLQYEIKLYDATGAEKVLTDEELSQIIVIAPDDTNWTLADGWWYYTDAIGFGEIAQPLFDSIGFTAQMGNDYQGCSMVLQITAQAVQQANNGTTVLEAAGWPEA
jgi:predicted ribosomally synthesized peptide with SipW-like signal peptide